MSERSVEHVESVPLGDRRYRGTVALVYGGALQSVHRSFLSMAPPDVNVMIATTDWSRHMLHAGDFDRDGFERHRPAILRAAESLVEFAPCDVLCIGGDLVQAAIGPAWCRDVAIQVERQVGVLTFMAMELVCEALRSLDAATVALVSAFPKKRSDHLKAYLEQSGFRVPLVRGVETTTNATIRQLRPETAYEVARRALEQPISVDALYLTCPIWHSNEAIQPLEDRFGIPVVTMFSPVLWKGIELVGTAYPVDGFGRLLAQAAASPDTRRVQDETW